jgi:starch-binding outer membrane protein, SusD/RagB family
MKYIYKRSPAVITNYSSLFLAGLLFLVLLSGCKKYLDARPDKQQVIPSTIEDARALLDNYGFFNNSYPVISGLSDDDYYLSDASYMSLSEEARDHYIWAADAYTPAVLGWAPLYRAVYNANISLETIDKIVPTTANKTEWENTRGAALFLRAFAFYHLAQHFAPPYRVGTASTDLGIPLRLSSDPTPVSVRSTVQNTWQQIAGDLKQATRLLPASVSIVSRPSRAAACAMLARVYLDMEDYIMAGKYADSSLQLYDQLLSYDGISTITMTPFQQFNTEVLFTASTFGSPVFSISNWRVDTSLYQSYHADDLRKVLFYRASTGGAFGFKGNYDGSMSGQLFSGIAVDEVWLTRAECHARTGNKDAAMLGLNYLLSKRYNNSFTPLSAATVDEALEIVLRERRKELVGRGLRWFDLRRLNKDPRFARTLTRVVNGQTYTLLPNDARYTHLIPFEVIALTGMQQNPR